MNTDWKTCFERIEEDLKTKKNLRLHFRIMRYESIESSDPIEKVCLTNKFSEARCDRYAKSVQINTLYEGVYLFGRVDVPNSNNLTHSCIPRIYLIKFNQIFCIREAKYIAPDNENQIVFDFSICCKEEFKHLPYKRKDIESSLANKSLAFNG